MRRIAAFVVVLISVAGWAQGDSVRYEHLAQLGRLWNFVKYVHPTVTAIDWDGALVRAIDRTNRAQNEADFRMALAGLLGELKDPATKLTPTDNNKTELPKDLPTMKQEEGGVAVVRIRDASFVEAIPALRKLAPSLLEAQAIVFDIRDCSSCSDLVDGNLVPVARDVVAPTTIFRQHSGYPTPDGSPSGGYYSAFQFVGGTRFPAHPGLAAKPIVFLVNRKTALPAVALALQDGGLAAIVSEDDASDEIAGLSAPFEIGGGVSATVRVRLLSHADGSYGFAPNRVLHEQGETALQQAVEVARSRKWEPVKHSAEKLPDAWQTDDAYSKEAYPDLERRLMAAMRIYGVFTYFHPYKYLTGEDWDAVLLDFLPRMEQARDAREYDLAVAAMVTHAHDSHCTASSDELKKVFGEAPPAFRLLWVEGRAVVINFLDPEESRREGVEVGDVVVAIDGQPVERRIEELKKYKAASTPQALMQLGVLPSLLAGPSGSTVAVTLEGKNGKRREATVKRDVAFRSLAYAPAKPGESYRLINQDIGYANLDKLEIADVDAMFEAFKNTRAIILDMRNYPRGTAWAIAPRLVKKPVTFAQADRKNPAAEQQPVAAQFRRNIVSGDSVEDSYVTSMLFEQRLPPTSGWRYLGKTAVLIDARAISQSEHSGLFYKAANGSIFVGSPTAGANGDVTWFMAPGGIRITFSGHDVRWPDGKQLQRIGLQPDVAATPTIAGIRAGHDEVLEKAIEVMTERTK